MNLDYDKIKRRKNESSGSQWTSYSDLFMVLSFVFLLLYVVTSLRDGADSYQAAVQVKAKDIEIAKLKEQLKVYEVLKSNYLNSNAPQKDRKLYENLVEQLHLLEQKADREDDELTQKARENARKKKALNKYQSLIKNIITANLLAQSRIKGRDRVIKQTTSELKEKRSTLKTLKQNINKKEKLINKNNREIAKINLELDHKIKNLTKVNKSKKLIQTKLTKQIKNLRQKSKKRIVALKKQNKQYSTDLSYTKQELESNRETNKNLSSQLVNAMEQHYQENRDDKQKISTLTQKYKTSEKEKKLIRSKLAKQLKSTKNIHEQKIAKLKQSHTNEINRDKAAFESNLKQLKLSNEEKLKKEKSFSANILKKNKLYHGKLNNLTKKFDADLDVLASKNKTLVKNLKFAQNYLKNKRKIAKLLTENFRKAGIKASVNPKTGEVIINFGNNYFDTDSSRMTYGMIKILNSLVPVYAKSLFQDPELAPLINYVEVIGFASPTYQGRFINPQKLSQFDRKAVNYNLDLSYNRAKSIFDHIFNTNKLKFQHQRSLLPLIKVVGRSFLAAEELKNKRIPAFMTSNDFCKKFNCSKSQKVIIRFHLDDRTGELR